MLGEEPLGRCHVRAIRCSPWTLLVVVILADAPPARPAARIWSYDGYLQIGASDCACAPDEIQVSLDGRGVGRWPAAGATRSRSRPLPAATP